MEDQLVAVLANTQSSDQTTRERAEADLKQTATNPAFPVSLANIASHVSIDTGIRQGALSTLRLFIQANWQVGDRDPGADPQIEIPDATREQLRRLLLELSVSDEDNRKVKISASFVVGKIATYDFPEHWPTLLPNVLQVISTGNDVQIHGGLRVLRDIIDESLSEEQFFGMARDIVNVVTEVALNESRKPFLRAMAVSVFRGCFDLMDIVKEDHMQEVKGFAEELLANWNPFFLRVLEAALPQVTERPSEQPESWNSAIALKLQVVKTLIKIKSVFPNLLLPQVIPLFTAAWKELSLLQVPHSDLYIEAGAQGRLEDADSLPYTLDFLVLEELDFLNQCFRASPVQQYLESETAKGSSWMLDLMHILVSYSQITQEEQGLWDIDASLYLAEETSVTANYTARTAAGDLVIKLGEWYNEKAVSSLFSYTEGQFAAAGEAWRSRESSLFLFNMLLSDFQDMDKPIPENLVSAYLGFVNYAIKQDKEPLLKARGYLVGGTLARSSETPANLLDDTIASIAQGPEVVQCACIKSVESYVRSGKVGADRQVTILHAISQFVDAQDPDEMDGADELLVTLAEALRAAIGLDHRIVLRDISEPKMQPPLDLLFMIAKLGANNFQTTLLVCEAFEEVVKSLSDSASYSALCARILPTLTSAFDVANVTSNEPLLTVATELLTALVEYGSEPLPPGFVAVTLPKLSRLLMESTEGEILRPGAEAVKYMLSHDHHQVFGWHDESGRSGLEVCLHIIDRLLGQSVEDTSASEVGGLAAELVEKAGQERLGPFLPQLLQAVATRIASAEAAQFVQSLILVFARLSLVGAHDVVEFLSQIQIEGHNGLQVVMSKWLENSNSFAGYDEIRQNVIALSKLYSLNDARLAQTMVKGDLIVNPSDGRILTRSRAKQNPDQYTIIPATLKIIKVLIEELSLASGNSAPAVAAAAAAAAEFADDENDDDGWEDDPDTLDLSLGTSKADLMSYLDPSGMRQRDDETQEYLTNFFLGAARDNLASFQEWYNLLTEAEKEKLNNLAAATAS